MPHRLFKLQLPALSARQRPFPHVVQYFVGVLSGPRVAVKKIHRLHHRHGVRQYLGDPRLYRKDHVT